MNNDEKLFNKGEHPMQKMMQEVMTEINPGVTEEPRCTTCWDYESDGDIKPWLQETRDGRHICRGCIRIQKQMFNNTVKLARK